jgi:flagellar hook-associated protein 3 FlgL
LQIEGETLVSGSLTGISENVSYALQLHARAVTLLQEQAATGNRINRGSDSPAEAYRVLGLNSQERALGSYQETIVDLLGPLQISSTILTDMTTELADVRTLLTQIVGGIYNADGRQRLADRLDGTLEQLLSLANTRHAGRHLFGGHNTTTAPYAAVREEGRIVQVLYQGSDAARRVGVAPGLDVEAGLVGSDVFGSDSRGTPIFLGATGAAAGTGTSSIRGDVWLTVDHDGENYRLSIDDGASFVTVPPGGEPNQAVIDSRTGRVLYVDTTGLAQTGTELVRVPGTYDLFGTLIGLRDMLRNGRDLEPQVLVDQISRCVAGVEEVRNQLVQANISAGSQIGFLETLRQNLENMQFDTQDHAAHVQEADIAQIAIDLSRREVLYQMSLAVAGKLMTMSLLDFIR